MSKLLSLKLREDVLREAEQIVRKCGQSRNAYFNDAIQFYNKLWERKLLKKRLRTESALVAADSMEVLEAFEQVG
ncbi:MAG TPA: hypothetical protein VFP86_03320 [bacterium]|nr:hypothetical protein [bacterium]